MKKNLIILMMTVIALGTLSAGDLGAAAADSKSVFTLEEMLKYAMEDEHLALAEYQAIMEKYGDVRPYSNIAESEKTHIAYLTDLYEKYNLEIVNIPVEGYLVVPASLTEAAETGVKAEIANIAMYEKFLKQDLPKDVRDVFTFLKNASENHLQSFQRQLQAPGKRN